MVVNEVIAAVDDFLGDEERSALGLACRRLCRIEAVHALVVDGMTCGTFCSKDWILMSRDDDDGPVTCSGSRAAISFSMAMMEAYSVAVGAEISARTLPGLGAVLPHDVRMFVAGSTPAGTSR